MTSGSATAEGTRRYASRFAEEQQAGFYRETCGLAVSSLGLGTYLGAMDEATDDAYAEAVVSAVTSGINFLDSAINYRHQRSERSIAAGIDYLFRSGEFQRDEIVVCTKAGFLTPGAIDPVVLRKEDVVGGMHSMAPAFLADQIDRSRANLGLETVDIFYLHNPETQLGHVSRDEFEERIRRAFAQLEASVKQGTIRWYGTATWNGYRVEPGTQERLELSRLVEIARDEGGEGHHFRFIQLPLNMAMPEAYTLQTNGESVLQTATRLGINVVASATLLQAKLLSRVPDEVVRKMNGCETAAQAAIQFTRSTAGIAVALVGMSNAAHVRENIGVARIPTIA